MYIHIHTWEPWDVHACKEALICTHTYIVFTYMHAYMHTHTHIHAFWAHSQETSAKWPTSWFHNYINIYICKWIHEWIHQYFMRISTTVWLISGQHPTSWLHTYMHTNKQTHTHTYTCICMHAYIHYTQFHDGQVDFGQAAKEWSRLHGGNK